MTVRPEIGNGGALDPVEILGRLRGSREEEQDEGEARHPASLSMALAIFTSRTDTPSHSWVVRRTITVP